MEKLITQLKNANLREVKGDKLHQTDARIWKAQLHELMFQAIENLELDVHEVQNGLLIEIPNEEFGSIVVEAKFVIKPLNYDIVGAVDNYAEKRLAAEKRKAERERIKAIDIANKEYESK